jgi:hypothetical protein
VGAAGGPTTLWNYLVFMEQVVEVQRYVIVINFTSTHNNAYWTQYMGHPKEWRERYFVS